jgi:carbonic anhydrase
MTKAGEIFVHRNIANQVHLSDISVNSIIQYAVEHLKIKHIIICGHTNCDGCSAAYSKEYLGGILDMWLSQLKETIHNNQTTINAIEDEKVKLVKKNKKIRLTEISRLNII